MHFTLTLCSHVQDDHSLACAVTLSRALSMCALLYGTRARSVDTRQLHSSDVQKPMRMVTLGVLAVRIE